jgi:hypothetical protein
MRALIFSPRVLQHCIRGDAVWTLAWEATVDTFVLLDVRGLSPEDVLDSAIQFSSRLKEKLGLYDIRVVRVADMPSVVSICRGIGYDVEDCTFVVSEVQSEVFMEPLLRGTIVHRM